ncbi:MAG: ACT domain-containing protein [Promethearchaeota archaeon]
MIKQLSVFLKNTPGQLMKVTGILAENNIQIRALTVAETADFGILRLIVNNPEKSYEILKANNILCGKSDVMAVEMEDKPGGLDKIAKILGNNGINIEYLYAFATGKTAILVLKVSENHIEKAEKVLTENNVKQFKPEEIYNL